MRKKSQYSALAASPSVRTKTLADLYIAIRADAGLPPFQKTQLISQIQGMTQGAGPNTPLSALMLRGLGGVIGGLIAKYFGMGPVGQLVTAVAGYGLASKLNNQLNKPPGTPGWRMLG